MYRDGQVERYNGAVWKALIMAMKSRGLILVTHWQDVLPDALHSLQSLLCTATNATVLHMRRFQIQQTRQSFSSGSVPTWLLMPGPVLLKLHACISKSDPLVDKAQLLQANPQYAHKWHTDGQETTISIRHLSPSGSANGSTNELQWHDSQVNTGLLSDRAS